MSLQEYMCAQIEAIHASMDQNTLQDEASVAQATMVWIEHHAEGFRKEWENQNSVRSA